MIASSRYFAMVVAVAALGGCAATPRPTPVATVRSPAAAAPAIQHNDLIGRSADAVGRLFGKPRLDVTEGAGRKLQYAGSACIIDVYFYAPRSGAEPVATHVDARALDGRNAEVAGCISAIRR